MKRLLTVLLLCLSFAQFANAATAWYQPTPYPSQNQSGTHVWDGWLNNSYNQTFVWDDKLQVGGWGDEYRSFIKFDLDGLPNSVTQAALWLMPYSRGDSSTPTSLAMCKVGSTWDTSMTWNTQPSYPLCWGWYAAPTPGQWWGVAITTWYNDWRSGAAVNNGVMFFPQYNDNRFDVFRSSRYSIDGQRPILQLDFTSTLDLKMPLPGNHAWLVTTEVGGYDCKGSTQDQYHDGTNYFSIDFSWRNNPDTGATVYTNPDPNLNQQNNGVYIPVIAAAYGKVIEATYTSSNGYYVVIDHDGDGDPNTGFQTRYLHLQPPGPIVSVGNFVQQGDTLGYMGNTGISDGAHLHFGVRYANSGAKTISELTKVMMDGWILKSFQSECLSGTWNRYYRSGNRVY